MKTLQKILKTLAIIAFAIFLNGIYYVFSGQFKSMERLNSGKELNLYECCSIYTMHMATWMFGWPLSKAAANECFSIHFPHNKDTVVVWNINRRAEILSPKVRLAIKSMNKMPIGSKSSLRWLGDKDYALKSEEHVAAIAINPCTITKAAYMNDGTPLYLIHSSMQYPKYSKTRFNLGKTTITIHEGLFRYLQDIGWLDNYIMEYGIYETMLD